MGHCISAVILKGDFDSAIANYYDLREISLDSDLTMFPIDLYYTDYWRKTLKIYGDLPVNQPKDSTFPHDLVIADLMSKISDCLMPLYALIQTDYFGSVGQQWADVYRGNCLVNNRAIQINCALALLGVKRHNKLDEFDTIGLGNYRSLPDYLNKYVDLSAELEI